MAFPNNSLRSNRNYPRNNYERISDEEVNRIVKIILEQQGVEFIEEAEKIAKKISNKEAMSSSATRRVYNHLISIKSIEDEEGMNELLMLKPKLAYLKARKLIKGEAENFERIIQKTIDQLIADKNNTEFINFKKFFEAIIGYYKYYYEKNKGGNKR